MFFFLSNFPLIYRFSCVMVHIVNNTNFQNDPRARKKNVTFHTRIPFFTYICVQNGLSQIFKKIKFAYIHFMFINTIKPL